MVSLSAAVSDVLVAHSLFISRRHFVSYCPAPSTTDHLETDHLRLDHQFGHLLVTPPSTTIAHPLTTLDHPHPIWRWSTVSDLDTYWKIVGMGAANSTGSVAGCIDRPSFRGSFKGHSTNKCDNSVKDHPPVSSSSLEPLFMSGGRWVAVWDGICGRRRQEHEHGWGAWWTPGRRSRNMYSHTHLNLDHFDENMRQPFFTDDYKFEIVQM